MKARIYRPARTAMQSGTGGTRLWVLEFEREEARSYEPLMGWTSSGETLSQVKLRFETEDEAIAYATRNGIAYVLETPHDPQRRAMAYADNFKSGRVGSWTH
jgi:ETC complex I subunit conserved region